MKTSSIGGYDAIHLLASEFMYQSNPKQGTTVATIEGYVTAAEQNGGGWVQLVFHHICNSCDAYSITATDFQSLLNWLQSSATNGVMVETTAQVIGGPVNPPVPA